MRCARSAQFISVAAILVAGFITFSKLTHRTPFSPVSEWILKKTTNPNVESYDGKARTIKSIMANSERLWSQTVAGRQLIIETSDNVGFFPSTDAASHSKTPYSVWDLVPASYNCPLEVERIGRMGDGGKWVCGMSLYVEIQTPIVFYSFGVKNESSFEQAMLDRTNCHIWAYGSSTEGFVESLHPEVKHRVHFTNADVGGTSEAGHVPPTYTIHELMEKNGHDYIDILKIDSEYAEFNALSSLNAVTQGPDEDFPIGQILVEFHLFEWQGLDFSTFLNWWGSMEWRGLRPVWMEPNLLAVSMKMDDGNARLVGYTWLNVKDKQNKLYN